MDRLPKSESRKNVFEILRDKKIAAALAMGVGVAALAGCAPSEAKPDVTQSQAPSPEVTETAPTSEETSTPEVSIEEQIEALKIPTGLSNEDLAQAYIDLSNEWWTAGADDQLREDSLEANLSWDDFLPQVAAENAQIYAPALYGPDWQTNPAIQEVLSNKISANQNMLANFTYTAWSDDPENKEAYDSWMEVAKVTEVTKSDSTRTLVITYSNHNNAEKNAVDDGTLVPSEAVELVFTEVDGSEVVTSSKF